LTSAGVFFAIGEFKKEEMYTSNDPCGEILLLVIKEQRAAVREV